MQTPIFIDNYIDQHRAPPNLQTFSVDILLIDHQQMLPIAYQVRLPHNLDQLDLYSPSSDFIKDFKPLSKLGPVDLIQKQAKEVILTNHQVVIYQHIFILLPQSQKYSNESISSISDEESLKSFRCLLSILRLQQISHTLCYIVMSSSKKHGERRQYHLNPTPSTAILPLSPQLNSVIDRKEPFHLFYLYI